MEKKIILEHDWQRINPLGTILLVTHMEAAWRNEIIWLVQSNLAMNYEHSASITQVDSPDLVVVEPSQHNENQYNE